MANSSHASGELIKEIQNFIDQDENAQRYIELSCIEYKTGQIDPQRAFWSAMTRVDLFRANGEGFELNTDLEAVSRTSKNGVKCFLKAKEIALVDLLESGTGGMFLNDLIKKSSIPRKTLYRYLLILKYLRVVDLIRVNERTTRVALTMFYNNLD